MQQATAMTPRKVAIFDFDGTIVDGQSGALFTTYLLRHGIMRLPRALHLGWWGLRYKLHPAVSSERGSRAGLWRPGRP